MVFNEVIRGGTVMPTPGEIRRKAGTINSTNRDIRQENDKYYAIANNTSTWWQGEAEKTFRQQYEEIHIDIKRLIQKIGSLEAQVSSMAGQVERAEDDRKEQERKRLADMATAAKKITAKK